MKTEEFYSFLAYLVRKYWLPLSLAMVGLILFGYGLISLLVTQSNEAKDFSQDISQKPLASEQVVLIAVDVEGAVQNPGVYKLKSGSILQDALVSSGGLSKDADRSYVSKNINLAGKLSDGQKIYIPLLGDSKIFAEELGGENTNTVININVASLQELDTLPGIGQVTAGKIINNRPYVSIDDLLTKKILTSKVFEEIKAKITAN